jgi:hypothetical protein
LKHIEKIVGIIFYSKSLKCSVVSCEEVAWSYWWQKYEQGCNKQTTVRRKNECCNTLTCSTFNKYLFIIIN